MTPQTKQITNNPDYKSKAYESMLPYWNITQALYDGQFAAKDAGLLNRFEPENEDKQWNARQNEAELYEVFASQVKSVAGLILGKDVTPQEVPDNLRELFADIDCCGNDLETFLRTTLTNVVRDGVAYVFVDAPPSVEIEGRQPTAEDVKDNRSFWVNYKAKQAINCLESSSNGKTELTRITFEEHTLESDGSKFGEKEVTRYRVLEKIGGQVYFSLYRKDEDAKDDKDKFIAEMVNGKPQENIPLGLSKIPVVKIMATNDNKPPFMSIANSNVKHFNKLSMKDYILSFIKPKMITVHSNEDNAKAFNKVNTSMSSGLKLIGDNAQAYYLELKGDSIPALEREIEGIENRMSKMGMEKFAPIIDGTQKTAFEVGSDNRKEMSEIAVIAKNFENGIESAFDLTIMQMQNILSESLFPIKDDERSQLKLNIDYDKLTFNLDQLRFFNELVDSGRMSLKTFYTFLSRVVEMADGWNDDEEIKQIASEMKILKPSVKEPLVLGE